MPLIMAVRNPRCFFETAEDKQLKALKKTAIDLIKESNKTEGLSQSNTDFLKKISGHLGQRIHEITLSDDNAQIKDRIQFIKMLLPLVKNNDAKQEFNTLYEGNINRFKGYISSRFYDILVERRSELKKQLDVQLVSVAKPSM